MYSTELMPMFSGLANKMGFRLARSSHFTTLWIVILLIRNAINLKNFK
jgi:hypothetical protein